MNLFTLPLMVSWLHIASTWFMVGLVWFVHCVHYPLLQDIPPEIAPSYERAHVKRTTPLIPLVMIAEVITAIWLLLLYPNKWQTQLNFGLLIIVWIVTFIAVVPVHNRLCQTYTTKDLEQLLFTNLIRSIVWLFHGLTSIAIMAMMLQKAAVANE
jgi:hypothetical protein